MKLFDTDAASQFLRETRGVRRSAKYLRKLRVTGGGPAFRRLNQRVYYDPADLEQWIDRLLGPRMSSTSELLRKRSEQPAPTSASAA